MTLLYRGARLVYHGMVYSISFACCVLTEAHRLFAKQLPPKKQLHALLDAYFDNIHPIRVFAFEHKPSFIRILDEGQLEDASDQALLHIMCALGARFYALDYSKSFSPLTTHLIQSAGSQWAKIAEKMFFADYSTISITKLKVLVLLHGQKSGNGNYAGSFLLTGLVIRMAHALQLNNEVAPETFYMQFKGNPDEVSVRESRRRLMWACYMIDVWAGSGVDHLTLLNERDLKIQLPCNERLFSLQIPCVTELLEKGTVLEILPAENIPQKPADNLGMAAYYVRIVNIWRRVLRSVNTYMSPCDASILTIASFVKHMDEEQQPWLPGSGFVVLIDDIQSWRQSLPSWLDFSADNIYIQRETHQRGALLLIHCMYHHVMCDVHRIALPDLFKNQKPIVFHTDQQAFVGHLQAVCFEHAQRMSISVSHILQHGVKYFADSILPSLIYNSSRIMLCYIARVLDTSKADAGIVIGRTVELVQCNIQALRDMALIYPLAESLCITSERWLETVRDSLACGHPVDYIAPQDPSENEAGCIVGAPTPMTGAPWQRGASVLTIPPGGDVLSAIPPSTLGTSSTCYPFSVSTFDQALSTMTSAHGLSLPSEQPMDQICSPPSALTSFEQPIFKLDDLQNFFGREASDDANAQTTGFEAFGPFGWADSFSV